MSQLPIIAAIPNYNMASSLDHLLAQLSEMNYDKIYVLDDASTDNSRLISNKYPRVQFVSHSVNQGSSSSRNQILKLIDAPCIIHFLDADVTLLSDPTNEIWNHSFTDKTGFVGGLVLTESGRQDAWNYGPQLSLFSALTAGIYTLLVGAKQAGSHKSLLKIFKNRPFAKNNANEIHPYWVIESNFLIYSETFKHFGGFDNNLREHDIQPLARKLYEANYTNDFNRGVSVVRSNKINVRHYNRFIVLIKAEIYMITKYIGVWRWIFSR